MTDLWIPPINPDEDLIQKEVCHTMQDAISLIDEDGGCYGIGCRDYMLATSPPSVSGQSLASHYHHKRKTTKLTYFNSSIWKMKQ